MMSGGKPMKKPGILSKKVFSVVLIAAIFTMMSFSQAFAVNLKFKDITASKYDWARPYIEKMYLFGIVKGVDAAGTEFAPDDSVKRDEIVTMIIRLMGLEEEAKGKNLPADFPKAFTVPIWARGYVAEAVEKGIISGKDLEDFRAEDPAKRYEVAVFAVKALGLEEEVQSRKNVDLTFTDTYAIPLEARAYVQVAVENGIIKGFPEANGRFSFKPNDKLTRAQAATLLSNLSKKMDNTDMVAGTVEDVDALLLPSIMIKLSNGSFETYNVNTSTSIYKEDDKGSLKKIALNDIKVGDNVRIIPDTSGVKLASYVEVTSKETSTVSEGTPMEGTIKDIDTARSILTMEKSGGTDIVLSLKNNVKINVDGKTALLSDLAVGQPVKVYVIGTDIVKIEAQNIEKKIKGILRSIITSTNSILIIDNEDTSKRESYTISSNVSVKKDGKSAGLSDLIPDDMATITIAGSKVVKIEAESARKEVSGTIKAISFSGKNPLITIEDKDGNNRDFELDKDADIRKNSRSADIKDLRKGDEVDVTLEYNKIVEISAKSVKRDISGTVKVITISDTPAVTITDEKGEDYTFNITPDTEIVKDRKEITVYDLRAGYYLDMEVEGDDAVSIDVTTREVQDKIEGTVLYIHKDAKVIVISVKNADGTKTSKEIHYTDDTVFMKGSSKISISRIYEGDQVIATGKYDSGLFFADTIIDLTISN
ncbi:S-layer homology domain-containing protein [Biomaibacter acetigenes]|uniref:S-layer homology domain-containing protein n=2 Tax=Biomaibacter acetigenes TaxID=2316383 RepID=A0A3G2R245_9FIRM|nr:S-layer homology domain-containing protein [Biomaibacter acetigenes]